MKKFALMGMILSILVCVFGAIIFLGKAPNERSNLSSPNGTYKSSGYASFGGDFYTYVNNNAAEAVQAMARNQFDIVNQISKSCAAISKAGGVLLLALGMLGFCGFGIVYNIPERSSFAAYSAPESVILEPTAVEGESCRENDGEWNAETEK